MKNVVAVILARGGSKGIPRKNVKDFCGKPLVAWTIFQAKFCDLIEDIYLSSDSEEILDIGKAMGIKTIKRPEKFASDSATSESAVLHALGEMPEHPDAIVMLEPTAPLRRPNDLRNGINQFFEEGLDSAFSGAALEDFLIWKYQDDGKLNSINYDYRNQGPRQMRKPDFVENGAIYMFKPTVLIENNNRFGGKIGLFNNEFWQSFEIDAPDDWGFVELIFNHYLKNDYNDIGNKEK
jgi:CMP-N,N'-diacetyllegionaminic acid synthase